MNRCTMTPRAALLAMTPVSYVLILGVAAVTGFRIDFLPIAKALCFVIGVGIPFSLYCGFRAIPSLRAAVETVFCGLGLTVPVVVSTYLAMRVNMPLADLALSAADMALGFDWRTCIHFVDDNAALAAVLGLAYQSFMLQLVLLPILLSVSGRGSRAYRMILSYGLICFVSSLVSIWFPAVGTYKTYGVAPGDLSHINAQFGYFFLDQFFAVRSDTDFVFSMKHAAGIITFPSVHAAVAFLCAWAAWDMRLLRVPFVVLNVAMALAAISHGSHYLVDVLAGLAVAALCVRAVQLLTRDGQSAAMQPGIVQGLQPVPALAAPVPEANARTSLCYPSKRRGEPSCLERSTATAPHERNTLDNLPQRPVALIHQNDVFYQSF